MAEQRLSPGRIVHSRMPDGSCRPCIVVRVWSPDTFNGVIFLDGSNDSGVTVANVNPLARKTGDALGAYTLTAWVTSAKHQEEIEPLPLASGTTWHWPERA